MAEIKNNFTGGKMNKDLDDRLVPGNEYRNAVNLQINKSENSDVGTMQTVLGNSLLVDFNELVADDFPGEEVALDCIGQYIDLSNNTGYFFLTDYADTTGTNLYSPTAKNYIFTYNFGTNIATKLVSGSFLNFSITSPIIGVNLLENLLFWTDDRNQPRKINVDTAFVNPNYYITEDTISVAKYYPYKAIELWQESEEAPGDYETTMKDVSSLYYPNGGECSTDGATGINATFLIKGIVGIIIPGVNVGYIDGSGAVIPLGLTVVSYNEAEATVTLSGTVDLDSDVSLIFSINPYYEPEFSGDPDYLKDKFVRFSYRFKFDDGEYSLVAPFTQIAFIPQQDGYFTYNEGFNIDDEEATYRSTVVSFMQNKVTQVKLIIPLPAGKSILSDALKITELDIIYKESDALSLKVLDTITIEEVESQVDGGEDYFLYDYNSKKPYKTLPSAEITRVYDIVPVKALAQEVISNRVVYGNYQDKHTPLPTNVKLNYNVAVSTKYNFDTVNGFTSYIEYPNHSLKGNRSYQVGVVLVDKFGRQSTVLLSSNTGTVVAEGQAFSGSTVYAPYITEAIDPMSWPGSSLKMIFNELIPVNPEVSSAYPGVYNGDIESVNYNPTGWYSYKIVVKQTEQEYYNVYLPGVMAAYPDDIAKEIGKTSHVVLINDNINKVPRDLSEVGPLQKQFRSSVRLYNRVNPIDRSFPIEPGNVQYYPGRTSMIVSTIADNLEMFNGDGSTLTYIPSPYFYNVESNPLIARVSTSKKFGVIASGPDYTLWTNLGVAETAPTESLLDIFWETTTTGSIVELNEAIEAGAGGSVILSPWNINNFSEDIEVGGNVVIGGFILTNSFGIAIDNDPQIITGLTMSVNTLGIYGSDVTSYFTLEEDPLNPITSEFPRWFIKVTSDFYNNVYFRGGSEAQLNNFVFTFTATIEGLNRILTRTIVLNNVDPIINNAPAPGEVIGSDPVTPEIIKLRGQNGCGNPVLANDPPLNWTLLSATTLGGSPVNYFTVATSISDPYAIGTLNNNSLPTIIPIGPYTITMRLTDAGGAGDSTNTTFNVRLGFVPGFVREYSFTSTMGGAIKKFVIIEVPVGNEPYAPGLYAYTESWTDLIAGGSVILIPSSGYSCPSGWLYNSDPLDISALIQDAILCIDNMYTGPLPSVSIPSIAGFTFSFS